ncbi:MAG TPA: response regulator [Candidatus Nitrosocosmicus sp.]|nr:response regulator [Candidatus Nitrosocosmicus sp.]
MSMTQSPSVMVVDDEEELANLFRRILGASGFNCVSFTDPLLALENFQKNQYKYTLVITDLRMPGINGIEFANEIRQYNQNVQILLLTAYFDDNRLTSEDFINADFAEVIEKPVSLKVLQSTVSKLCNSPFRT